MPKPPSTPTYPPLPPAFIAKKTTILSALSTPPSAYTDASPKGSVDEPIKPLIDQINALEGAVTTSSCAGRLSVYLEGSKADAKGRGQENGTQNGASQQQVSNRSDSIVPGGKGNTGHWLYVSHSPIDIASALATHGSLSSFLGLSSSSSSTSPPHPSNPSNPTKAPNLNISHLRLIRLQFEPLILHIQTASLAHAAPLLSAAMNAGFRESGVQSLKTLVDPGAAGPMVGVRTMGVGMGAVVGYCVDDEGEDDHDHGHSVSDGQGEEDKREHEQKEKGERGETGSGGGAKGTRAKQRREKIYPLVDETYLRLMLDVANARFEANVERRERLEWEIQKLLEVQEASGKGGGGWEDAVERRERMRKEGLRRRDQMNGDRNGEGEGNDTGVNGDGDGDGDGDGEVGTGEDDADLSMGFLEYGYDRR